jgi:hypothetical protein
MKINDECVQMKEEIKEGLKKKSNRLKKIHKLLSTEGENDEMDRDCNKNTKICLEVVSKKQH